jgi:hypothetical protein
MSSSPSPSWLLQSSCRAWAACVGDQVMLHTNHSFGEMFMTGQEMEGRMKALRICSFYLWSQ